jgi:hypothetical protein
MYSLYDKPQQHTYREFPGNGDRVLSAVYRSTFVATTPMAIKYIEL